MTENEKEELQATRESAVEEIARMTPGIELLVAGYSIDHNDNADIVVIRWKRQGVEDYRTTIVVHIAIDVKSIGDDERLLVDALQMLCNGGVFCDSEIVVFSKLQTFSTIREG